MSNALVPVDSSLEKPRFATLMAMLNETYARKDPFSQTLSATYWDVLKDLPIEAVEHAVRTTLRSSQWLPKPSELRELALQHIEGKLRSELHQARETPWQFECSACQDTGFTSHDCIEDDPCRACSDEGRHLYDHRFVRVCPCRLNNRTYQRGQEYDRQRVKARRRGTAA